jgi:glycosyltransferase involved in cell wall biosynthesis
VLGWIGGKGNLSSLERIVPELVALRRRHDFVLRVVSDGAFSAPDLAVENVPWSLEHQEAQVAGFDLGLMPLDGASPFDLGKCSYKVLQYMAAGVVPVADAVGMNAEVIRDGENGCLIKGSEGWGRVLKGLLEGGRGSLAPLGQAARRDAQDRFSYEKNADALAGFFQALPPVGRST